MDRVVSALVTVLVGLFVLGALVAAVRASAKDARRRGKSPVLVALLVVCFFPLGLIAWVLFRPARLDSPPDLSPLAHRAHRRA